MVNACVAPGCRSGYSQDPYKGRYFHFPKTQDRLNAWIRAMPRKYFIPTKYSVLCELHFSENDFTLARADSNNRRPVRRVIFLNERNFTLMLCHMSGQIALHTSPKTRLLQSRAAQLLISGGRKV